MATAPTLYLFKRWSSNIAAADGSTDLAETIVVTPDMPDEIFVEAQFAPAIEELVKPEPEVPASPLQPIIDYLTGLFIKPSP